MVKKLFISVISLIFVCVLFYPITVGAYELVEDWGFEIDSLSQSEKQEIINNRKISFSAQKTEKSGKILDYDISNDGNIAICFTNQMIEVYNNDGEFLYEISFCVESGNYGIMWHDDNLLIMSGLGYSAVEVSSEGNIVDVISIRHHHSQGNKWSQYVLSSGNHIYKGYIYNRQTKQGFFDREVTSYITKKSLKTGEEAVVIECRSKDDAPFFWFVGFPLSCILVLALSLFFKRKRRTQ